MREMERGREKDTEKGRGLREIEGEQALAKRQVKNFRSKIGDNFKIQNWKNMHDGSKHIFLA